MSIEKLREAIEASNMPALIKASCQGKLDYIQIYCSKYESNEAVRVAELMAEIALKLLDSKNAI